MARNFDMNTCERECLEIRGLVSGERISLASRTFYWTKHFKVKRKSKATVMLLTSDEPSAPAQNHRWTAVSVA